MKTGSCLWFDSDATSADAACFVQERFWFSLTKNLPENFTVDKLIFMIGESGSETIQRVLGAYHLGEKLRRLRLRKKIALADLAKHTGLSTSMLSQLRTEDGTHAAHPRPYRDGL